MDSRNWMRRDLPGPGHPFHRLRMETEVGGCFLGCKREFDTELLSATALEETGKITG
jgi:hypothetical protein